MRILCEAPKMGVYELRGIFSKMHSHKHQTLEQINIKSLENILKSRKIKYSFIDPLQ